VSYSNADHCKAAHDKCQGAKVKDFNLVVLYARKRSPAQQKKDQKLEERKKQGPSKYTHFHDFRRRFPLAQTV
jgi:hypothetical protein